MLSCHDVIVSDANQEIDVFGVEVVRAGNGVSNEELYHLVAETLQGVPEPLGGSVGAAQGAWLCCTPSSA